MKYNSKIFLLLASGAMVWFGCQAKTVPVGAYSAPVSTSDRTTVANFNILSDYYVAAPATFPGIQTASGPLTDSYGYPVTGYNINPTLYEANTTNNDLYFPGRVLVVNNFPANEASTLTFEGPGANQSAYAAHILGVVNDPGTSVYPTVDFQAPMDAGNQYNMSFFTGVKFYFKTGTADSAIKRVFNIPIFDTQAAPSGGCDNSSNKCYDHFSTTLNGTSGSWQSYYIKFTDMTRQGFGFPLNPTTFSGANLTQVLWLQWEEGNNNNQSPPGGTIIDFWVDEIQFVQ